MDAIVRLENTRSPDEGSLSFVAGFGVYFHVRYLAWAITRLFRKT
jgi:hypothetical protein